MLNQEERVNAAPEVEANDRAKQADRRAVSTGQAPPEPRSNDQYIQKVIEIEKQADAIYENAVREAERLPVDAEREAKQIIEQARREAQEEARQLTTSSKAQEEGSRILSQAEDKVRRMKTLASSRVEMAVCYILDVIAGKEE